MKYIFNKIADMRHTFARIRAYHFLYLQKQPLEVFFKISQNSRENTCARVSFLIKLQASDIGVFCEFCEIFKITFFTEHLQRTASVSGNLLDIIWDNFWS